MMVTFRERKYEQEPIVIEREVRRALDYQRLFETLSHWSIYQLKELVNKKASGADEIPIEPSKVVEEEAIQIFIVICT